MLAGVISLSLSPSSSADCCFHDHLRTSSFDNFVLCLRAVRLWAKRRGIYSNKMGYLGGINCNILTAYIAQLYPRASASVLLFRFFHTYANWKWPQPVMLCAQYQVTSHCLINLCCFEHTWSAVVPFEHPFHALHFLLLRSSLHAKPTVIATSRQDDTTMPSLITVSIETIL